MIVDLVFFFFLFARLLFRFLYLDTEELYQQFLIAEGSLVYESTKFWKILDMGDIGYFR